MLRLSLSFLLIFPLFASSVSIEKQSTCTVASNGNTADSDLPALNSAISSCGSGGTIILSEGKTYALNSVWNIGDCKDCEIQIEGTLKLSDNYTYWNGQPSAISANGISGAIITSKTGHGIVDGNGQGFWEIMTRDSSYRRPTLVVFNEASSITVENLYMKNAPAGSFTIDSSTSVNLNNITISAVSTNSSAPPKNTDGFDIGHSSYVTISNSKVTNDDDCVAFKPGASYVTVDTLT